MCAKPVAIPAESDSVRPNRRWTPKSTTIGQSTADGEAAQQDREPLRDLAPDSQRAYNLLVADTTLGRMLSAQGESTPRRTTGPKTSDATETFVA